MENLVNQEFWRGKRVLITGHTGFKGCWLSLWLSQYSAIIKGFSLPISDKNYLYNKLKTEKTESSFFQMLTDYIITGFKVAMIVAAMMIGFLALLALLDHIFASILGISFREILGYIFYPIAWIIGIPSDEALHAGMIMGTKVAANEFPAIDLLKQLSGQLSEHSKAIVTIFLISFANFGSIGIITGSIKALSNKQGNVVAKYGFKLIGTIIKAGYKKNKWIDSVYMQKRL